MKFSGVILKIMLIYCLALLLVIISLRQPPLATPFIEINKAHSFS